MFVAFSLYYVEYYELIILVLNPKCYVWLYFILCVLLLDSLLFLTAFCSDLSTNVINTCCCCHCCHHCCCSCYLYVHVYTIYLYDIYLQRRTVELYAYMSCLCLNMVLYLFLE